MRNKTTLLLILLFLIYGTNTYSNEKYIVKKGDNLYDLSNKFGVSIKSLKQLNGLKGNRLDIGDALLIPDENFTKKDNNSNPLKGNRYIVEQGDTLEEIAKKFNISVKKIKKANNLKSDKLDIGDILIIKNTNTEDIHNEKYVHVVAQGDTLSEIGAKYGISVKDIKSFNRLKNNGLQIGQRLTIPLSSNAEEKFAATKRNNQSPTRPNGKNKKESQSPKLQQTIKYVVNKGDSLSKIAYTFGTSIKKLKDTNNLSGDALKVGQVIKIPYTGKAKFDNNNVNNHPTPISKSYIVKKGDNLYDIAKQLGLSVQDLKNENGLTTDKLNIGDLILIPYTQNEKPSVLKSEYIVKRGDTLGEISLKFKVPIKEIKNFNKLHNDRIKEGARLIIPGNTGASIAKESTSQSNNAKLITYEVKKGDSLSLIAYRHNTSVKKIKHLNNINGTMIRSGQKIKIPVDPNFKVIEKTAGFEKYEYSNHKKFSNNYHTTNNNDFGKSIIKVAKKYLGAPYKFGGTSYVTGIDCSAYVNKVFSNFDVDLPRTAREIFKVGRSVSKSRLAMGDLVFFTTYARYPSHVGIYIGGNKFIHASSKSKKVTIDNLDRRYYKNRYIGAKRIESKGLFYDEMSKEYKGFEKQ